MRNRIRQFLLQNAAKRVPIKATTTDLGVEINVYDVIDPYWGESATAFADTLKQAAGAPLTVRINSPGGDAFEGRAIASQIRSYAGPTRCIVDGCAASAASTIAIAGGSLSMASGSFLMIHQAWSFAMGNGADLRQAAELLDKVDAELAADYVKKTKCSLEQAVAWMQAETWFTAQEAVDAGFANAVVEDAAQFAAWNLGAFEHAPQALVKQVSALASVGKPKQSGRRPRAADPDADGDQDPTCPAEAIAQAIDLLQDAQVMLAVEEALEEAGAEPPDPGPAALTAAQVRAGLERRLRLFQIPA